MQNETDIELFQQLIQDKTELKSYYNTLVEGYEQKINSLNLNLDNLRKEISELHLHNSKFIHELRNQTTIVKSTSQLFETRNQEVLHMNYWNKVVDAINIYQTYLDDYSIFNRSNDITRSFGDLDLFILDEIDSFYPLAIERNIHLSYSITDEAKPYFNNYSFDSNKLKHVFQNIIRNAFDACEENMKIQVNSSTDHTSLIISISNNGKMIPSDEIDSIFDPYISFKSGGSGLGLVIVSSIIQAHKGSISVRSSSESTTFTIKLPI